MADKPKDLYEILGVNKNATDSEIKKARNKLVTQWHPDSFTDPEEKKRAEAKMKEINGAYEILGDPQKRAQYDQFGHAAFQPGGGGAGGFDINDLFRKAGGAGAGGAGAGNFDMNDIFGDLFGDIFGGGAARSRARNQGPERGADLRYDLSITFEEAAFGKEMNIKVPRMEPCEECGGSGAAKGTTPEVCPDCNGTGMRQTTTRIGKIGVISNSRPCERCHGTGKIIKNPCPHCNGAGKIRVERDFRLNIPRGVNTGTRLRIQNGGQAGTRGGPNGDLYVYINIKPHPIFSRENYDVHCEIPISFVQAALGATVEAPTLDGKIDLKIPEGTQSGAVLRVRGRGVPFFQGEGRGDEYVKVKVLTPKNLSAYQRKLLQDFEKTGNDSNNPEQKSFVDKLKGLFS